jgi:hypothetical protein
MSENMTKNMEKTIRHLIAAHGHSAMFVCYLDGGVSLYIIGDIHYAIREDGTARSIHPTEVSSTIGDK